ncbi:caspase family protein [Nitrospira defluvii]|uniref:Peptidase C14 n=1 Tax=Nitrospira defluvii TaxID=330214 RepID=A0ABN7M6E3_9BACT|nr:caspase family protein [Nitrospira defluvii]CAE6788086.1 Peptidase C14 [Nitrospira defluvii]
MANTTSSSVSKPKALSLHIGLNAVSPSAYGGWSGDLTACEFDAKDMAAIAKSQGMKSTVLLTKQGTRAKTLAAMRKAVKQLKKGDLFFLTYSGHGGQVPDVTGEETDKQDETWCLFDGQLIDDELYLELSRFAAGVRILVFSDSCHSGTVTRARPRTPVGAAPASRSKMMPPAVALRTYREHQQFYDKVQRDVAKVAGKAAVDPDSVLAQLAVSPRLTAIAKNFKASVILISGCQDNQTSMDGEHNGAFTEQVLNVWNHGTYRGNYAKFHAAVRAELPASQTPNLFTLGAVAKFLRQQPFSV